MNHSNRQCACSHANQSISVYMYVIGDVTNPCMSCLKKKTEVGFPLRSKTNGCTPMSIPIVVSWFILVAIRSTESSLGTKSLPRIWPSCYSRWCAHCVVNDVKSFDQRRSANLKEFEHQFVCATRSTIQWFSLSITVGWLIQQKSPILTDCVLLTVQYDT